MVLVCDKAISVKNVCIQVKYANVIVIPDLTRRVYNLFQDLWNKFLFFSKVFKITKKGSLSGETVLKKLGEKLQNAFRGGGRLKIS